MKIFEVFEAKALRTFKEDGVKAGDTVYGTLIPNGRIYLSKTGQVGTTFQGPVFETYVVENVDFVKV